jgi:hypothetical protein
MFEKINRAADKMVAQVSLSRRGFLGRLGNTATAAAGVLGGAFLFGRDAQARGPHAVGCFYRCQTGQVFAGPTAKRCKLCPRTYLGTCVFDHCLGI